MTYMAILMINSTVDPSVSPLSGRTPFWGLKMSGGAGGGDGDQRGVIWETTVLGRLRVDCSVQSPSVRQLHFLIIASRKVLI